MRPSVAMDMAHSLVAQHVNRPIQVRLFPSLGSPAATTYGNPDGEAIAIAFSEAYILINDERVVRDIILHEIAHVHAGVFEQHNEVWAQECAFLGIEPLVTINDYEGAALPSAEYVFEVSRRLPCLMWEWTL